MINAEKYKKEILEAMNSKTEISLRNADGFFMNKYSNKFEPCSGDQYSDCDNCLFDDEDLTHSCGYHRTKWLLSECKEPVELSKLEYEFLKWSEKKGHKYIVRDKINHLFIFKDAPIKRENCWVPESSYCSIALFDNLFPFIKWEDSEPTSIQEVLENCEVVEDAEE